jgi:hypothetical protein
MELLEISHLLKLPKSVQDELRAELRTIGSKSHETEQCVQSGIELAHKKL